MCRRAVAAFAKKVEATQPAAFAELYNKDYSMKQVNVNADGTISVDGFDPTNIDPLFTDSRNSIIAGDERVISVIKRFKPYKPEIQKFYQL